MISLIFIWVLILSGCSSPTPTAAPVRETQPPIQTPVPTKAPQPTEEPEPIPCMIAFDSDRDGNREVYIMGPDGSNPVNLSNNPADDFDPSMSPDGSQIAFVSNRENDSEGGQFIYIMNSDGSNMRQLTLENDSNFPDWSNDGRVITYTHEGDIFIIKADGSGESINLTNSPEEDVQSVISPDGSQIAWLSGGDQNWNIFLMNTDGSDVRQLTHDGKVYDTVWTIDGRLFTHWDNQEVGCMNCVMDADGSNVIDAGGKGTIQEYLPFWTVDGNRVECVSIALNDQPADDIYLVGEIFPDIFLNLTNNPGNDRNPDWPVKCGGTSAPQAGETNGEIGEASANPQNLVIGYESGEDQIPQQKLEDLLRACEELQIQCTKGSSKTELANQGVDAIISFSNRWRALGDFPEISDTTAKGIPVIVLDGESDAPGAYNLSTDSDSVRISLIWMFKEMGDAGEMVYYNFGNNGLHQAVIDAVLKEYPEIQETALPADFQGNSFTVDSISEMISSNPNLEAIWSDQSLLDIFWGVDKANVAQPPLILCEPRLDNLQSWKERLTNNPKFKCLSTIQAGGTAYEGVYVAYYILTGLQVDPAALGGLSGKTFIYDYPIITNDNLDEWLGKLDSLRTSEWGVLELAPMTPEEIREKWFLE